MVIWDDYLGKIKTNDINFLQSQVNSVLQASISE